MKFLSITIIILAIMGLLAFKNPTIDDYNDFVRPFIVNEFQKKGEKEIGKNDALGMLTPFLGKLAGEFLADKTVRTDYIFFSLYDVKLGENRLKLLGILGHFVVLEKPKEWHWNNLHFQFGTSQQR